VGLVATTGLIANDTRGQLNRAGVDGNAILLDEQKLLPIGNSDNDCRPVGPNAVHVFPTGFFNEREEFAGAECNLCSRIHGVLRTSAL
jgi:hypothetical protein